MQSLIVFILRQYKRWLSPFLGPHCRFYPSCSSYAASAVERHGTWRGLWLTVKRVVRCNPWFEGGIDPVPDVVHRDSVNAAMVQKVR